MCDYRMFFFWMGAGIASILFLLWVELSTHFLF